MPTRNVNLTEEMDRFVSEKIDSGRYESASEVVRAALRTLEREELEFEAKLAALRTAIDEGDASGLAAGGVFARVRRKALAVRRARDAGTSVMRGGPRRTWRASPRIRCGTGEWPRWMRISASWSGAAGGWERILCSGARATRYGRG